MQERAEQINAVLEIVGTQAKGTTVRLVKDIER